MGLVYVDIIVKQRSLGLYGIYLGNGTTVTLHVI